MMFEQQSPLGSDQDFSAIMNAARHTMPRLLVIDDDNLHRMIICRVAAKAGFVPAGAASYDEAARLAQETNFDCITLDLSAQRRRSSSSRAPTMRPARRP
jgi:chemotaxis response regulator CheB